MKQSLSIVFTGRLKVSQFILALALMCSANAQGPLSKEDNVKLLTSLNPYVKSNSRGPNNFVPDEEARDLPTNIVLWYENILVEDTAGVMRSMKDTYDQWEKTREYAENWNMESTGLYDIKGQEDRVAHFNRHILKYLDKRLSGEIKQAEEGSALARVGTVQKALKPQTNVDISPNVKLKFKARVLQAQALMYVDNPWVNNSTTIKADGRININVNKNIGLLGLNANLDYSVNEGQYVASLNKTLTKEITARVTSSQTDKEVAFTDFDQQTFEVLYNLAF
ncbi:hypothetical protein [Halobacteriovorax sp. HLS]|uniref:hypothetical protein n=1 Tax=Halobacteriovorax sp. HLS TaxID=2234000 RepID=UPI000FD9BB25|nr:hypothetical protein [Halobacteriovorax sp. HLS]